MNTEGELMDRLGTAAAEVITEALAGLSPAANAKIAEMLATGQARISAMVLTDPYECIVAIVPRDGSRPPVVVAKLTPEVDAMLRGSGL